MRLTVALVAAGVVTAFAACSQGSLPQRPAQAPAVVAADQGAGGLQHYDDPFSYCRALGTLDRPDERYAGPNPPPAVIAGLIKSLGVAHPGSRSSAFVRGIYWRCMDGAVYACSVGANLPCESRADTNRVPTKGEQQYCGSHPRSSFIPMYVTGHATVYDWRCEGVEPVAGKQLSQVDARGFIAGIWYEIPPPGTRD